MRCPVSADIEAGYGASIEEVLQTVKLIVEAGVVGINIEDTAGDGSKALVPLSYQVDLFKAIRRLAESIDIPLVVNARIDVFLRAGGSHAGVFDEAVERANAYREAGADCLYPFGLSDADLIKRFIQAVNGPVNIMASPATPPLPVLTELGVARVTFASELLRAALGYLRVVVQELREQGIFARLAEPMLSGAEFQRLFDKTSAL